MPNPSPTRTEEFISKQFKAKGAVPGNQPLAKRPTSVKLPIDVDAAIKAMSAEERTTWLRRVICDAAHKEQLVSD